MEKILGVRERNSLEWSVRYRGGYGGDYGASRRGGYVIFGQLEDCEAWLDEGRLSCCGLED